MRAVDSEIRILISHCRFSGIEYIREADFFFGRDLRNSICVGFDVCVVPIGGSDVFDIFIGDGRKMRGAVFPLKALVFRSMSQVVILALKLSIASVPAKDSL